MYVYIYSFQNTIGSFLRPVFPQCPWSFFPTSRLSTDVAGCQQRVPLEMVLFWVRFCGMNRIWESIYLKNRRIFESSDPLRIDSTNLENQKMSHWTTVSNPRVLCPFWDDSPSLQSSFSGGARSFRSRIVESRRLAFSVDGTLAKSLAWLQHIVIYHVGIYINYFARFCPSPVVL